MALSAGERDALAVIADRAAAEDPEYARRLAAFGGYEVSPLGAPSKWTAFPVAVVGVILALGALAVPFFTASDHPQTAKTQGVIISR